MNRIFLLLLTGIIFSCQDKARPDLRQAAIFLKSDDSSHWSRDTSFLLRFPFVVSIRYRSKEEARRLFIEDGNQDWSEVLNENPLPASYEVTIDMNKLPGEKYEVFKSDVLNHIPEAEQVVLPYIQTSKQH